MPIPTPASPRPWWPVLTAGLVAALGAWLKWSCLGADGLTLGETAVPWCYSDVVGLFQGRGLAGDPVPYREVMTEYPPLTALQWWLAGSVSRSASGFFVATAAMQTAAAVVSVAVLRGAGVAPRRLMVVAAAPALLLSGTINWDLVATALLAAGLVVAGVLRRPRRPLAAGILLGLGGLAKVFPLLAAPMLAWWAVRGGDRTWARRHLTATVVTVVVVQVPVALWAPDGWASWITVQRERPVDWDTVWYAVQTLTGWAAQAGQANTLVVLTGAVGVAVILRVGVIRDIPRYQLLLPAMAWLLLSGKVHSPQFTLWLLPLVALSRVPLPLLWAWLVADAAVVLTRFPFLAGQQGLGDAVEVTTLPYPAFALPLAVRGVLLLLVIAATLAPPASTSRQQGRSALAG